MANPTITKFLLNSISVYSPITYMLISKTEFLSFGFSDPYKRMLHRMKSAIGLYTMAIVVEVDTM